MAWKPKNVADSTYLRCGRHLAVCYRLRGWHSPQSHELRDPHAGETFVLPNPASCVDSRIEYWCWIGQDYMPERIAGEYIWLWCTLAFSFALYIPLFFFMRGNIKIQDPTKPWKVTFRRRRPRTPATGPTPETESEQETKHNAYAMLA
jgi:hypothetical protein